MLIFLNRVEVLLMLRIKRISQKEFADLTGLSEVHISRMLNRQASVGLKAQKKIQEVFKFKPFERLFVTVDK